MTVRATNMHHALSMARQMDRVTDQLHEACSRVWDAYDLVEIATSLSTVAGRLSEVYDHIAETASAAGAPIGGSSIHFNDAADCLREAAACMLAPPRRC